MLCLTHPTLYTQFDQEDVTSSYYASAWFITVFTNSLQRNVSAQEPYEVNESLLQLWDYFLVGGWKAITKAGLYLMQLQRTELEDKSFE